MRIEGALIMEISYRLIDLVRKPVTGTLRRFSVAYLYLPLTRSNKRSIFRKEYPMIQMKQAFNTALNKHYRCPKGIMGRIAGEVMVRQHRPETA